jgi:hypothetical protein
MGVVIAVYPVAGGHSHGSGRIAQFMRGGSRGSNDMVFRVAWGVADTMETLFSRICQAAPIANRNGVDVVNIVHDDLAAHFVQALATPFGQRNLRGIVTRCFKPSTIIFLVVSNGTMDNLLARGSTYAQTFQGATAANAHIRIGDHRGQVLAVN